MSIMLFSNMQINGHVFSIFPVKLNTEFQSQKSMHRVYKRVKNYSLWSQHDTTRRKDVNVNVSATWQKQGTDLDIKK